MRRFIDIIQMPLTEQAASRKEALRDVNGAKHVIASHAIQLIVMPNSRDRRHWQLECAGKLREMLFGRLKSGGFLKEKDFREILFTQPFSPDAIGIANIESNLVLVRRYYVSETIEDFGPSEILHRLKIFYNVFCKALSMGDAEEAMRAIESL